MDALESVSVKQDIVPFAFFLGASFLKEKTQGSGLHSSHIQFFFQPF